jgi:hypothetical protein
MKIHQEMTSEQLIQDFDDAYERLIEAATTVERERIVYENAWGPREVLAHIVGWAAQAIEFIPQVLAGQLPQAYISELQHAAIDDAFNAAFITLLGNQPFEQMLTSARQTHEHFIELLRAQDETIFVPGNYVYERMKRIIDHYRQHAQELETKITTP